MRVDGIPMRTFWPQADEESMNQHINRRQFLKRASLLPLCGMAVGSLMTSKPAAAQASRPTTFGVSLNAYSFNKFLLADLANPGASMTLMAVLDYAAAAKFDAIDPTGYYFPGYPKRPDDAYLDAFKHKAADLGVAISGTGVRNNFTTSDKSVRDADVQMIKDWIEVSARLGAPVLRVFADTQKGLTWQDVAKGFTHQQVQDWIVDDLKQCVEHAKQFGVRLGLQNHGDFLRTAQDVQALLDAVDSPWCGPIVDIGSFKSKDPYADIAALAPRAVNWQIKQSLANTDPNFPPDLPRLMHIVRASGYHGYLPIETLTPAANPADQEKAVSAFLKQVREAIAGTG
jgi:sugar phosphate isomerase/epimerase